MELFKSKNLVENKTPFRFNISSRVMIKLCELVKPILKNEPNILELAAPINIFGDEFKVLNLTFNSLITICHITNVFFIFIFFINWTTIFHYYIV